MKLTDAQVRTRATTRVISQVEELCVDLRLLSQAAESTSEERAELSRAMACLEGAKAHVVRSLGD